MKEIAGKNSFKSLVEVMLTKQDEEKRGIVFINGSQEEEFLAYAELYHRALNILYDLQNLGLEPGDELIFQISDHRSFLLVFWACLMGKIIPVPVSVGTNDEHRLKLMNILKTCRNPYLIITRKNRERLEFFMTEKNLANIFQGMNRGTILLEDLNGTGRGEVLYPHESDIAYIQFSSGSTGEAKGVMLTHKNLLTNISAILKGGEICADEQTLGWMPLTHDMGLIGFHLAPFVLNMGQFLMMPELFVRNPLLWLNKISEHNIDITSSPNFGYRLLLKAFKPESSENIDLSSLRLIFNGAEPISAELCHEFLDKMAPLGLKKNCMFPVYGLAEASLGVTFPRPGTPITVVGLNRDRLKPGETVEEKSDGVDRVAFVEVGTAVADCEIRMVDDEDNELEQGMIGNIQIRGPNVTSGYYNNIAATARTITGDGWLRTGDLGFFRRRQLVITGRAKDIIFCSGKNYYAHDIERVAEDLDGIEEGRIVFCGVYRPELRSDEVICFVLFRRKMEDFVELALTLKQHILRKVGVEVQKFIPVKKIFKTTSGKLQRYKLRESYLQGEYDQSLREVADLLREKEKASVRFLPQTEMETIISGICRQVLERDEVNLVDNFFDIGGTSLHLMQMKERLEDALNRTLDELVIFKYPTIRSLAKYLSRNGRDREHPLLARPAYDVKGPGKDNGRIDFRIAVIGMSGRFPGAGNIDEFWTNLKEGRDAVSFFVEQELSEAAAAADSLENPNYVKAKGVLDDTECFDVSFFGYTPREAETMDPQTRVFHECVWAALEHAGYVPGSYPGLIGIFAGASPNTDWQTATHPGTGDSTELFSLLQLNDKDFMSTRASYRLNLRGPSYTMYTACSTSLVAVDLACKALIIGDCDIALAGGVSIALPEKSGYMYQEEMVFSPDGHCRAFDAGANGIIFGDGAAIVALKRLPEAEADGDFIWAVIRSSAINNDGSRKVGYSAPSIEGQAEVIRRAHHLAGVEAESIGYVETHGAGTAIGDPIEIQGLTEAFNTAKRGYCPIGSLKSNVGHLNVAAGAAGLIKTILALKHRLLPPSLHFEKPNPKIDFENSPFYVNTELKEWQNGNQPLRAGVSSFGIGGTNAHVILEEAPLRQQSSASRDFQLILLSAKSESALDRSVKSLAVFLAENRGIQPGDVAYTLQTRREAFEYRCAALGADAAGVVAALESRNPDRFLTARSNEEDRPVVFMFSGQGSQYVNMGLGLYRREPVFREHMDRCFDLLEEIMGENPREILYPADDAAANGVEGQIGRFTYSSPLKFAFDYSLAKLLIHWGICPEAMIGHSFGEYVAACIAGVFSLEDALSLVTLRGNLMHGAPQGQMLSVPLSEERLKAILNGKLSLAAVNTPSICLVSGPSNEIQELKELLEKQGHECIVLRVPRAAHSWMMEPILAPFEERFRQIRLQKPQIPYISGLTGTWIRDEEAMNPEYWARHLRQTIRFADGIEELLRDGRRIFIEVGAGRGLSQFVNLHPRKGAGHLTMNLLRHRQETVADLAYLLHKIGRLWANGKKIDWDRFYSEEQRQFIPLPTYPFEKRRFPLKAKAADRKQSVEPAAPPAPAVENRVSAEESMDKIKARLKGIVNIISGLDADEIGENTELFSLGLDSLMLVQFKKKINKNFGIDIALDEFLMELTTLARIAEYIDEKMPRRVEEPAPRPAVPEDASIQGILAKQLEIIERDREIMSRQLDAIRSLSLPAGKQPPTGVEAKPDSGEKEAVSRSPINIRAMKFEPDRLDSRQQEFVENFIKRYNERTGKSKEYAQRGRSKLSDWINSLNFRLTLKDLLYPVVSARSDGSKFWDIDGNEYIDIAMGYGVSLLGHRPQIVTEAIGRQLAEGFELAPQSDQAAEVAELICQLTGAERVAFGNTGTDVVMAALRIARTVTGRRKIVRFAGSYHGTFDGLLAEADEHGTFPLSPGTPQGMVDDTVVLPYGSAESLDEIRKLGDRLAGVLVEPVQSRKPGFQPADFLQKLRKVTSEVGAALIFDEVLTGFRIHPGGAQEHFGIQADIVTYGKILGGGMPIGVVAGKAEFLDAVDGGLWNFGDTSYPSKQPTFFAGTFCKHPLSMAAAQAVLCYLKQQGPALQERVNEKTRYLAETLNEFFDRENVPMRVKFFGSLFRFESFGRYDLALLPIEMDLFFYLLMEKGVYTWERRVCFLSAAHSDEDIEAIMAAVKRSIQELRQGGFDFSTVDVISFPLSSAQKRLYILNQMEGGERPYHVVGAMRVAGKLDIRKTEEVFRQLLKRHRSLRTGFQMRNDEVVQRVTDSVKFSISPVKVAEDQIGEWVRNFIQPFDLAKPPLMRAGMAQLSPDSHLLVMDFHHIIADGYSLNVIARDFVGLYQGMKLPPIKMEYEAYVGWEEGYLASTECKRHHSFWMERFSGELPLLNLPADFPRPAEKSFDGSVLRRKIEKQETDRLKESARSLGASLYMILLAAYNVLLFKLTGQEDIIVGTPVAVRDHGSFEAAAGMFTNTMALRNYPAADKSFEAFLREVKTNCLQAYVNQDYPFDLLINDLGIRRDLSTNPLFNVMFTFEDANDRVIKIKDLTFTPYDVELNRSMFDFTFEALEEGGCLRLNLTYDTHLFKKATIEKWVGYFGKIVEQVVENRQILLGGLEILSDSERHEILTVFNRTKADFNRNRTVLQMFEDQVKKTPNRLAVAWGDERLTYRELDERANRLAAAMRKRGLKPNTTAAILLARSWKIVAGILGVLKSGGAFLPMDPGHPQGRIDYMLKDSQARLLLTQEHLTGLLTYDGDMVDVDDGRLYKGANKNLHVAVRPQDMHYTIYTSGTTGKPKGVVLSSGNLLNYVTWLTKKIELNGSDKTILTSSFAFDMSYTGVYGSLVKGGELHILPRDIYLSPDRFLDYLDRNDITWMKLTPSLFSIIVHSSDFSAEKFKKLRFIMLGGEKINVKAVETAHRLCGKIVFMNHYGPTEATVGCITQFIDFDRFHEYREIPTIGHPIDNTRVYILDKHMKSSPVGAAGQLYVSGLSLAKGYLNRPELTACRFVDNPFEPAERLYDTGDLARWLPDGRIEFLGRLDGQVKIRGYRIELGEIEKELLKHREIKKAVVITASPGEGGDHYLVAYIVATGEVKTVDLRKGLSENLPDYMIPAYFVFLKEIPLGPSGKVDTRALPAPAVGQVGDDFQAPADEVERKLAQIWAAVIGIGEAQIGVNADFFQLGGHSLKATLMVSKIYKEMNIKVPLESVFRTPTIGGLAAYIKAASEVGYAAVGAVEKREYYPLSSAQKRLFILWQVDRDGTGYNMPSVMSLEGNPDMARIEGIFKGLILRHESLRTSFRLIDEQPVQEIYEDVPFGIEYYGAENLGSNGDDDPEKILFEKAIGRFIRPFDLSLAPLLRVGVLKLSPERYILMVDMHHVISDGLSVGILVKEFIALYKGEALPALKSQYKDYSQWQLSERGDESLKLQELYWLERFSGEIPVLEMPLDFPRPDRKDYTGESIDFVLDKETAGKLNESARQTGATLYMVLLALYNLLLMKYTGQREIIVGSPIIGRPHPDLQSILGVFVNMLPMRNRAERDQNFKDFLEEVRENALKAYENQDYQFEELVKNLNLKRDMKRNPLFDTVFQMDNIDRQEIDIEGLKILPHDFEYNNCQFDLILRARERGDVIDMRLTYQTALYKKAKIEKMIERYLEVVRQVVADPEVKIRDINISHDLIQVKSRISRDDGDDFLFHNPAELR